jgi:hypothetical protein
MAYEIREGNGSLFRNEKKQQPNQRDYNGSCMIGGQEYWISAWLKPRQDGTKYMSLAFEPKQQQQAPPQQQQNQGYQQPQYPQPGQSFEQPRQQAPQQQQQPAPPQQPYDSNAAFNPTDDIPF